MRQRQFRKMIAALLLAALAACGSGCDFSGIGSNAVSFALGALAASQIQTTTTEYRCFRDGIEIDCADLPSFVP